jgi:ADP-ribose pyrophosphatase
MKTWQVIKSEYIYQTPFGNLRSDKVALPNGHIIENYYVNEFPDCVNMVAIIKNNEIILVKQYRHGGKDVFIEVPAGKVDEQEFGISCDEGIA